MNIGISRSEAKTLFYWVLVLAIIMLIFVFIKINVYDPIVEQQQYTNAKYEVVTNNARYYTAITPIYKLYEYISNEDVDSIIKILNEDYVKNNEITKDNLKTKGIFNFGNAINFDNQRMCSKHFEKDLTSYIVKGEDVTEPFDMHDEKVNYLGTKYYEIILDSSNFTFNITPISEETYERGCNNGRAS